MIDYFSSNLGSEFFIVMMVVIQIRFRINQALIYNTGKKGAKLL